MLRFLSQLLASILATLIVLFVIIPAVVIGLIASDSKPLPSAMVLSLDLRQPLPDKAPVSFQSQPGPSAKSVVGIVQALERAEQDERVKALYLRVGGVGMSLAEAQELREALTRFKATGKKVIAHSQSLFTPGLGAYYVGIAADEFWMQPDGAMLTSGLQTSSFFMKSLLDEIGVEADFQGRKEYKGAANGFLYEDYPEPMREARTALITSIYDAVIADMSQARGISTTQLKEILDDTPILAERALELGLVDKLGHELEARRAAKADAGSGVEVRSLKAYLKEPRLGQEDGTVIALVHATGPIAEGSSSGDGFGGSDQIGGDTFAKAVMDAVEDDAVKAILLRVDSPGGSAIASEQVRYALNQAQIARKPVIVSMATVAASGGYWISMSADHIAAHPATITGSIGVIFGKFAVPGLLEKIGVNLGEIATNDGALLFSPNRRFSEAEWARVSRILDAVYADFIGKASEGRGLDEAELERHARGRVWSGVDALERELIDSHGGLRHAMDVTREKLGLDMAAKLTFKEFPSKPGVAQLLENLLETSVGAIRTAETVNDLMAIAPVRQIRQAAEIDAQDGPLAYEDTEAVR